MYFFSNGLEVKTKSYDLNHIFQDDLMYKNILNLFDIGFFI